MPDSEIGEPRITFGMIVLNGEPFIRYNLRALYPFAFEIIVVEGAVAAAAPIATRDGHSTDNTLEILQQFKSEEDPQGKVTIITRDGFWSEKHEQSQAYANHANGNYLWQIDADEFYQPADMQFVIEMLANNPQTTAVSFKQLSFWGGFDYLTDGWYLHQGGNHIHRLFRWGTGYRYVTHRPPTIHDEQGRDLRSLNWITGHNLADQNIWLYHYPLVFPKQVLEKSRYYDAANWVRRNQMEKWANDTFLNLKHPYRVHNVYDYVSWLERFEGRHPPQINALMGDLTAGVLEINTRTTTDIENLLQSPSYRAGRAVLKKLSSIRLSAIHWERLWKRKLLQVASKI
jgi:glycosyltransferase involved in cell wall biosynthesis